MNKKISDCDGLTGDLSTRYDLLGKYVDALAELEHKDLIFRETRKIIRAYFRTDSFYLAVIKQGDDFLKFPMFRAGQQKDMTGIDRIFSTRFIVKDVLQLQWAILVNHYTEKTKYLIEPPVSWIGVPVRIDDRSSGALVVAQYDPARIFRERDTRFLSSMSRILSLALGRIRAREEHGITNKINETLFRISEAVNASDSLDSLYRSIHELLSNVMELPNFYIAMHDPVKKQIHFPYLKDEYDDAAPIDVDENIRERSLTASVIFKKKSYLLTKKELAVKQSEQGIVGKQPVIWAGVPLLIGDEAIGAMVVQHYVDPEHFSKKDVQLLEAVSEQIGLAIERTKQSGIIQVREAQIQEMSKQTEQFSNVAASILSVEDEAVLFDQIGKAIIAHSEYSSLIVSYFKDEPPYRDIIAWGGYDPADIAEMRKAERPRKNFEEIFKNGEKLGKFSYYIPHEKSSAVVNQGGTAFSDNYVQAEGEDAWHPEDFLFVKMFDGKGNFVGVISVDNPKSGRKPTNESIRPLEVFSSLISQIILFRKIQNELNDHKQNLEKLVDERTKALQLEIIERKKAQKEKEKLIASKREMEIAKNIQTSLLPDLDRLADTGFDISANMTPADDVGGDYYDLIRAKDGRLWFGIGDVTGHGLISGLIMMMAQVSINTLIRSIPSLTPEEALIYANQVMHSNIRQGLKVDHHMTISFIVEESPGTYRYAGAHEIILIYRSQTNTVEQIPTKGMWMGILPDITNPIKKFAGTFRLFKNDVLFLYTDGVIEICNEKREQYDLHRLESFLLSHGSKSAHQIKQALLAELNAFKDEQTDDITFMVMKKM